MTTSAKPRAKAPPASLSVLWLSHLVPHPAAGGASQRSYHLLCQAASRHRVHLMALHRPRLLSADLLSQATADLSRRCTLDVIPLVRDRSVAHRLWTAAMGLWRSDPYETIWLENRYFRDRLAILARTSRYDVVHVDTLGLLPYAAMFPDAAAVLTHHDIQSHLFARRAGREGRTPRGLYSRYEAGKLERAERAAAPRVAVNITVSPLDALRLGEIAGATRSAVVPNGVDVDYFRPTPGDDSAGLVFAASFDSIPNQDAVRYFLGEIWPVLLADDPRRRVTFVGRGPGADLKRAAADRRVTVTGPVADVRPFIAAATVYVCPLRVGRDPAQSARCPGDGESSGGHQALGRGTRIDVRDPLSRSRNASRVPKSDPSTRGRPPPPSETREGGSRAGRAGVCLERDRGGAGSGLPGCAGYPRIHGRAVAFARRIATERESRV